MGRKKAFVRILRADKLSEEFRGFRYDPLNISSTKEYEEADKRYFVMLYYLQQIGAYAFYIFRNYFDLSSEKRKKEMYLKRVPKNRVISDGRENRAKIVAICNQLTSRKSKADEKAIDRKWKGLISLCIKAEESSEAASSLMYTVFDDDSVYA